MNLFAPRSLVNTDRANEIKTQLAAHLGLTEDATIMVSELACFEEGCPPVETVLAVFERAREKLQFKLHCPIAEVTEEMIRQKCKRQNNQEQEKVHGKCCD